MATGLFGTDGVRGAVGSLITADLALALGNALPGVCESRRPQVLLLRDTRESGPMLESALAAGIAQGGGDAWIAGVLPTPAASILVRRLGLDLAAVISASHNPWQDNGIKFFGPDGRKLANELEERVEAALDGPAPAATAGRVRRLEGALDDYVRELTSAFALDLSGMRVALDCANGATHRVAPVTFERLGATVQALAAEPDGRNINDGCGSTHPELLTRHMTAGDSAIGFAFDGDGDRVVAVDGSGEVHDGDGLLALTARFLAQRGELDGGVVVTVMSNYGFHRAMEATGIEVETTDVGDRNVAAALERRGWSLGGEQSGHLIWRDFGPTGDGIAAALLTLRALDGQPLEDTEAMAAMPQVLRNVEVEDRAAIADAQEVWTAAERESAALEGRGRVLLRPSGTEPLVRVMVEAEDPGEAEAVCARLVETVRRTLG